MAAVQAVARYGANIWWQGQRGWCEEYQRLVNRQGRAIRDMFPSAPEGVVIREAGHRLTISLLNNKQQKYELRLLTAPITQPTRDILPVTVWEGEEQA